MRTLERTPVTNANAMFWEFGAGASQSLVLQRGSEPDDPRGGAESDRPPLRAPTMLNIAGTIASSPVGTRSIPTGRSARSNRSGLRRCSRPGTSYPSAHSCISTAAATVLGHLFPTDAERVQRIAEEAGESRIWGGIHFRSDVIAGTALGQAVGEAVIASALGSGME